MIQSMTAYARKESLSEIGALSCEIRGVNHRYLDISLRMPEELRLFEPQLREKIRQKIRRGKLEVSLRWQTNTGSVRPFHLNPDVLSQLLQSAELLKQKSTSLAEPNWLDLLRWPGMLLDEKLDESQMKTAVMELLDHCLSELISSRQREGQNMQSIIADRLAAMSTLIDDVEKKLPDILQQQKDKLKSRLEEIKAEIDQNRLEQEIVILAQRMDVDEELQRLRVHIAAVEQTFARNEPVGRRLDFLMQELNREANTLGSKSISTESSNATVEMKVLIEQMREQIQNIE